MQRPKSPPIDRNYRKPRLHLPPGACDTHFHFIGPQSQFPLMPDHVFSHLEFEDTTIEDWLVMQDGLGLTRGVLVQSMMYGHNYELALHGLSRFPDRLRAVIAPWPGITDRELEILTKAGVVGARFAARLDPALDERMIHRVHEFGWSANYLGIGENRRKTILASPGRFVIERAGHVPPGQGTDSAAFKFLLQCLDTGRCWIKLNPRFSAQETFPFSDIAAIIRRLVAHAPNRLVWCTDWPHPQYFRPMPNDADLVDIMGEWVPDEATRNRIFADNPAELYNFPPAGSGGGR
ncbi:MAG TPA: amidohydrolase family protein [Stellaceae bacterium]|nr:amidohydrolase family protein [Stellaceae bacterium]